MKYKMTPELFFEKLINLYVEARKVKFPKDNIVRGRNAVISAHLEDLLAFFIASNNPKNCNYFTDQAIRFGKNTFYPDVVIQKKCKGIDHLVDVKADIGWNRKGMLNFCKDWDKRIELVKGQKTSFKDRANDEKLDGVFSQNLKYHVVIVSLVNSGKLVEEHKMEVQKNVKM